MQDRECLFGDIVDETGDHIEFEKGGHTGPPLPTQQMVLNDAGKMVKRWYCELENKYPDKRCHEMVIMPNHFHCIIENMGMGNNIEMGNDMETGAHVGAPLRGRPFDINGRRSNDIDGGRTNDIDHRELNDEKYGLHNKKYNAAIGDLVDWFKTMTTNEYIRGVKQCGWKRFDGKLWQRNYYEHIIRSTDEFERITNYIIDNPSKWHEDKFFK